RDHVLAGEEPRVCGLRRAALAVDDGHAAIARRINDDGRLAAEAEMRDLDDGRGEDGRDPGVDGVAARGHHPRAGIDRERPARRHDAMRRANLPADRRGSLGRQRDAGQHERRSHCVFEHDCCIVLRFLVYSSPPMSVPARMLACVAAGEVLGMTLWFSATAAAPAISRDFALDAGARAWLTMAVQAGVVVGTPVPAAENLPGALHTGRRLARGRLPRAPAQPPTPLAPSAGAIIAL